MLSGEDVTPFEQGISIEPGRTVVLAPVVLRSAEAGDEEEAAFGYLNLTTRPWSEVYCESRKLGTTPLVKVRLPAGPCHLKLVPEGQQSPRTITVPIHPGETARLSLSLSGSEVTTKSIVYTPTTLAAAEEEAAAGTAPEVAGVVRLYESGQFRAAAEAARQLAAAASNAQAGARARALAGKIDRFAETWATVDTAGSERQTVRLLEEALSLDQAISSGHYAPEITPRLREAHIAGAERAYRAGRYATSCQSAHRAEKLGATDEALAEIAAKCESKARELYERGVASKATDLEAARGYFRKVLSMVPRSSPWYSRAYTALGSGEP
jgi:hypothetical protein